MDEKPKLLRRKTRAWIVARREQPFGEGLRVDKGLPRPKMGRRHVRLEALAPAAKLRSKRCTWRRAKG